ncbi:dsba oxidoreductase [Pseudomonas fluorescens]|uniref:Dsba oxidoreductase n=1 Tax=Pseudomonas fluorescens TaxID=294 RepID=A0A379IF65_PSEFL|nr:thioredoxin domain-containing protein [Pseudomonas fluorescens]SUD31439.1 dsba oxidoreductase [Pseudomonas fluorescens]
MRLAMFVRSHPRRIVGLLIAAVLVIAGWTLLSAPRPSKDATATASVVANAPMPSGPPWVYGQADARFTVIEYADLECPYCRAYFPVLKQWIDDNPEVNVQWHHLPLSIHEPAATAEARLAECAGEVGGHEGFWQAVAWIYSHSRGDGQGLPADVHFPEATPAVQSCLDSDRPDVAIRAQAAEAAQSGIAATPTLRLRDSHSGKTLLLHGTVEGDALMSAIDLLSSSAKTAELPADAVDDLSR